VAEGFSDEDALVQTRHSRRRIPGTLARAEHDDGFVITSDRQVARGILRSRKGVQKRLRAIEAET